MENDNVVNGLLRRRQEVTDHLYQRPFARTGSVRLATPTTLTMAAAESGQRIRRLVLEVVQGQMRQLVLDLDALDATLRLFRPDVEIGVARIKPIPRRHASDYMAQIAADVLAEHLELSGFVVMKKPPAPLHSDGFRHDAGGNKK